MKRGLKGFAFLVSGLVLGIIGATVSATAIALSAVGMAKVRHASKNRSEERRVGKEGRSRWSPYH